MQGHAAPTAVQSASPEPVTVRSYTTPFPAAQRATLAEQQRLPEVSRHPPVPPMAQTPPDSLMERWALAVAGQPPAAEHQPAEPRFRDGSADARTRGAPREQTANAPGVGRASMKRFVKPGLVDRWAQAQQRRQQQEAQVHMAQTPPDSLMERWALAVAGQPPAAEHQLAKPRFRDGTADARTRGAPREQAAVAPGVGRASMKRFVKPGLVDRWAQAQQRRQQQEAQGRQPAGRPAAPGTAAAEKQATSQKAAAGKPAPSEKGVVAPARTLMDRWSLAVRGIKPLPQEESSSKPAAGPSAAAEGRGFAGSKAAAWKAPPACPTGEQAERFVEPGLMERWKSAMQSREAGQQPGSMSMPVWCLAMWAGAILGCTPCTVTVGATPFLQCVEKCNLHVGCVWCKGLGQQACPSPGPCCAAAQTPQRNGHGRFQTCEWRVLGSCPTLCMLMIQFNTAVCNVGGPPKQAARPLQMPPPCKQDQNKLPAAGSVGKQHQAGPQGPQGAAKKRLQERSDRYIR